MDETLEPEGRPRPAGKSATAFRTISEVSAELDVPQHVLRFWETKFPQIRPLKRGGGRRYYRPDDVDLLRRIQHLLYKEGYTIKGVQRLLKETRAQGGEAVPGPVQPGAGLFDREDPVPGDGEPAVEDDSTSVEPDSIAVPDAEDLTLDPAVAGPSALPAAVRRNLQGLLEDLQAMRQRLRG